MTNDERLERLVRELLPPADTRGPTRDLWPLIVERGRAPRQWSWLDLGLVAALIATVVVFPRWLLLLVYHL